MALSDDQVKLFRHNGFLRLPGRMSEDTVAQLREAIHTDVANEVEPFVRDKNGDVIRLSQVLDRAPIFREVATSPLVLDSWDRTSNSSRTGTTTPRSIRPPVVTRDSTATCCSGRETS